MSRQLPRGPCLSRLHPPRHIRSDTYRFVESWGGFRIEHPQRHLVEVRLVPWGFAVAAEGFTTEVDFRFPPQKLGRLVASLLLGVSNPRADPPATEVLREAWAIAGPLHALRAEILVRVNSVTRRIHEVMRPLIGRAPGLARTPAFLRHPHLAGDVVRYPAAAIALAYHGPLLQRARGIDPRVCANQETIVEAMSDWRGLFSPDGRPYRSLNRTLMNLPAAVPAHLVRHLNRARLERPILNATELTTLLLFVSRHRPGAAIAAERLRIFLHATEGQIQRVVQRIGEQTGRRLDAARERDLDFAIRFLEEYPGPSGDGLDGLFRRALNWHVRPRPRPAPPAPRPIRRRARDGCTARPPIPLPDVEGITFLATVADVVREGARMHHCIASFADRAARGECFLFHVEHGGQSASVAIDRKGVIMEAAGPCNVHNAAVFWATQMLRGWATDFTRNRPARRRRRPDPNQLLLPFLPPTTPTSTVGRA